MTLNEIIEMAHRLHVHEPCHLVADAERRLMELVATIEAKERETCAKIVEEIDERDWGLMTRKECADAIRTRGKNDRTI